MQASGQHPEPVLAQTPAPSPVTNSPHQVYQAFRDQRDELASQLERLKDERRSISRQLQQPMIADADKKGLEQRLAQIDLRIAAVEKDIATSDANVAKSAAIPGAVVPPPQFVRHGPPEEVFFLSGLFMIVVLLPISIAYARRIWRRGAAAVMAIPQEIYDRFSRVDQSLDAIAIEVERIGEGQRFLTRVQAEQQRAIGAGPAERVESKLRDAERQR